VRWPWSKRGGPSAPGRSRGRGGRSRRPGAPPPREVRLGATLVTLDPSPTVRSARQRCEYCRARAKVRADFTSGPLYFCGHHAYSMWRPLADKAQAILIDDSRELHWLPKDLFPQTTTER
jgi:hypothetical protein